MSDCIRFKGHIRKSDGYGILSRSRNGHKRIFMAHRWVWSLANDYDPWNLPRWVTIKQTCENHWCINPDHLESDATAQTQGQLLGLTMSEIAPGIPDKNAGPILSGIALTPGGMAHRAKTKCSEGHLFREAPDDTPCISCKVQKKQDIMYEVTT